MSPDDIPLLFHTSRRVRREELRQFLGELTKRVARGRTIACLIADDGEMRRLNRSPMGSRETSLFLSTAPVRRRPSTAIRLPTSCVS